MKVIAVFGHPYISVSDTYIVQMQHILDDPDDQYTGVIFSVSVTCK